MRAPFTCFYILLNEIKAEVICTNVGLLKIFMVPFNVFQIRLWLKAIHNQEQYLLIHMEHHVNRIKPRLLQAQNGMSDHPSLKHFHFQKNIQLKKSEEWIDIAVTISRGALKTNYDTQK